MESLARIRLTSQPVAIAFLAAPPSDLERIDRSAAAGCSYWKHASEGHAFYTTPEDHQNCPIGAFTHGVELSPEKGHELNALIGTMIELRYLRREEIPEIPHRSQPLAIAAYSPLARATFPPDVVVFRGNARQVMLLAEAARAAGAFDAGSTMGRPACAAIPHALHLGVGIASLGCIGNRVYTGLEDDELYLAIPAGALDRTLENVEPIFTANETLETYHRQRAATLGA